MTVCYRVLAPISGAVFNDANGTGSPAGQSGLDGVAVTIVDNTTGGRTTVTTANGGDFSSPQPVGDSYTVCSASPGSGYQQSAPTSGASCPGGLTGYTVTGGSTTNYFGFRPLGSVAGTVYNDANQDQTNDTGDSPLSGWTVTLYGGAQPLSTTSNPDGSYKLNVPFSTSTTYTLCETPPSGTWAQDVPLPSTPTRLRFGSERAAEGLAVQAPDGRRHDHRQRLRQRRRRHVQSGRIRSFSQPRGLRRQHSALELLHGRLEGAHRFRRRLRCPAGWHPVRQRLERRLQRARRCRCSSTSTSRMR